MIPNHTPLNVILYCQCVYRLLLLLSPNLAVTLSRSFVILTLTVPGGAIVGHSSGVGVLSGFPMVLVGVSHFAEAGVSGETCSVHAPACG